MCIRVTVFRSADKVKDERLASGANTPNYVYVDVDPESLSLAARKILLAYGNERYQDLHDLWDAGLYVTIDTDYPTAEEIDVEIIRLNTLYVTWQQETKTSGHPIQPAWKRGAKPQPIK